MADERGLAGLSPYDLQDTECARLAHWFGTLDDDGWAVPSGCEGWSRHDLLAHLVAVEEYFAACLDGSAAELMERYAAAGAASVDEFGIAGVDAAAGRTTDDLMSTWVEHNASNRAGFRAADGADIDSSVGPYPARSQAFHVAFEYGIHANDVDAPVSADERDGRQRWLAGVARFALTEMKAGVSVEDNASGLTVTDGTTSVDVDIDTFIAGVSRRAPTGSLDPTAAALFDLGY